MVTAGLSVIAALLGYVGLTYYLNERPEYAGAEPFEPGLITPFSCAS